MKSVFAAGDGSFRNRSFLSWCTRKSLQKFLLSSGVVPQSCTAMSEKPAAESAAGASSASNASVGDAAKGSAPKAAPAEGNPAFKMMGMLYHGPTSARNHCL